MNRNDFRKLALIRLREARTLLRNRHYEGAYYLCGYVIECGLKACIAKKTKRYDFPDKKVVNDSYTHSIEKLVGIAGLRQYLQEEMKRDKNFENSWARVKDWSEEGRYQFIQQKAAEDLFSAASNKKNGVLKWIKQHW